LRKNYGEEYGDAYSFTALERRSKLIVARHLGKPSVTDTFAFADKLSRATSGRFEITTAGFAPYKAVIPATFGNRVDFATLVKLYGRAEEGIRY
jgi:hypothetical protein